MVSFMHIAVFSQLSVNSTGINYVINFDNTVDGVNNGHFTGSGFEPVPASGRLDSDAWATTGMKDGNSTFGDTKTSSGTDFTRGTSSGGVGTGGFYSFQLASGDYSFGIQPGTDDWTPGTITLRIINNSGSDISAISISYNVYIKNDAPRANTFNFSYSSNNSNYTPVTDLNYTSPATATVPAPWTAIARSTTITGLNIPNGAYFYFRWSGDDVSGSDTRDEFALNDIVINCTASNYVADPAAFDAVPASTSANSLSWALNVNNDSVMIAWSNSSSFGTPTGAYSVGAELPGGGIVLYKGTGTVTSHAGLPNSTKYYYKAWSKTASHYFSSGLLDSAITFFPEPSDHPSNLTALSTGDTYINVSWQDADAGHYLVKGNKTGYNSIVPPSDGIAQGDSLLVKNVNASVQSHRFTGLMPNTSYYFKIYPYNGTGSAANYKTNGTVPQATATTASLDLRLIISEVADPADSSNAKFVELYNCGTKTIDFATTPVFLCRQANGSSWSSFRLNGTLIPGGTQILAYVNTGPGQDPDTVKFLNAYGFEADRYSSFVSGNGNDGYFLFYGSDQEAGHLIDAFGVIGENGTGEAWEYTNKKAVRKRNMSAPNPGWNPSEWVILADTAGAREMTPGFHRGEVTWMGTSSSHWSARGNNWSSPHGFVPDASCKVIIPEVMNSPVITEPSACHEMELQTGAVLGIQSSGSLLITGP
jgi:hypothetical protein